MNLQQQVQKNKEDIARHYAIDRALANFGIKVVGSVNTSTNLPNPETYTGEYGDAYVVGTQPPYTYWIYTRPDPNAGYPNNYWLDVGNLSIQGDKGDPGVQGPQGPSGISPKIIFGNAVPTGVTTKGDVYVVNQGSGLGETYQFDGSQWIYKGNFKGAQGIQGIRGIQGERGIQGPMGPQGKAGTPGPAFYIVDILEQESDLSGLIPADKNAGYLIGTDIPYTLYLYINDLWTPVSNNFVAVQGEPGAQGAEGKQGEVGPRGITGSNGQSIYAYSGELDATSTEVEVSYTPALIIRGNLPVQSGDLLLDQKGNIFKITTEVGEKCVFTGTQIKAPPETSHPITYTITANSIPSYYGNLVIPIPQGSDIDKIEIIDSINYQSYNNSVHFNEIQNVVIRDGGVNVNGISFNLNTGYTGSSITYPTTWNSGVGLEIDVYSASGGYFTFEGNLALILRITTK